MSHSDKAKRWAVGRQPGFSLIELIVVLAVLTTVSGIIMTVIFRMAMTQGTVANRTQMHGSVRSATELLQQEIGQAGRVASPASATAPATLSAAVLGNGTSQSPTVSSVTGLFPGEVVYVGPDATNVTPSPGSRENLTLTTLGGSTITAIFQDPHASGAPIAIQGLFAAGIVPPTGSNIISWSTATSAPVKTTLTAGTTPGSSATLLKLFGDINGDGSMVYVEYNCDTTTVPGNFSRRVIPFNTALAKTTANFPWVTLLSNLLANPGGTPCFDYQTRVVGNDTYVVDVAVTLTVQTQNKDPQTKLYQKETKALLNVSPRNVYEAWQLTSSPGGAAHIQPMPQTVLNLLNP